jgi:hypothetical protein
LARADGDPADDRIDDYRRWRRATGPIRTRVLILVRAMSQPWRRLIEPLAEVLTALLSLFMII